MKITRVLRYWKLNWIMRRASILIFVRRQNYKTMFEQFSFYFNNKKGLEIGGPSGIFSENFMPIYDIPSQIDGCNYSTVNLWHIEACTGYYNYYKGKHGIGYVLDGTNLKDIGNETYDFVLASHNLEHIANPLKAVKEWKRVLKKGGALLLILPDRRFTFDRNREVVDFKHLIEDYENDTSENDLSHLKEVLEFHDLSLDINAGLDPSAFRKRCENNYEIRGMHHHVFDQNSLKQIAIFFKMEILCQYFIPPYNQILICRK